MIAKVASHFALSNLLNASKDADAEMYGSPARRPSIVTLVYSSSGIQILDNASDVPSAKITL